MAAHADLGASGASRWTACPGSIARSRGAPDRSSSYAQYGTAAHELASVCLEEELQPEDALGRIYAGVEVDAEMVSIVRAYVDEVNRRTADATEAWVERRFTLDALNPPVPMFGTADMVALLPTWRLVVCDLKAGAGVRVTAQGNLQLAYYALGALLSLPLDVQGRVRDVEMVIIQPRAGGVSEWIIDVMDLLAIATELLAAAKATQEPEAKLVAGPHCRFCKARVGCEALEEFNLRTATAVFDDDPLPDPPTPTLPHVLDETALARCLDRLPILESWISGVRSEAMARLSSGDGVPGWKLVAKRATRRWANEDNAAFVLTGLLPDGSEIWEHSLISPAQAEKLLPKADRAALAPLIAAVSSGPTMARESDPRPAVASDPFADDPLPLTDLL